MGKKINDFHFMTVNNKTKVICFNHSKVLKSFGRVPKSMIQNIATQLELYLYGEMCMHTGKHVYKIGKLFGSGGGVVNLFTTTSKAKFNRFVCEFVNTK